MDVHLGQNQECQTYDPQQKDRASNVTLWMRYLPQWVLAQDVDQLLYDISPAYFLFEPNGNVAASAQLSCNTFWKYLGRPENKQILDYILLSKKLERVELESVWIYDQTQLYAGVQSECEAALARELPRWLRERYVYQWLRTSPPPDTAIRVVEKTMRVRQPRNIIQHWILLRYAEALMRVGREVDANLALTNVFDHSPSKRFRAMQLLNTDRSVMAESLRRARKSQRATLITMLSIQRPSARMQDMEEVWRLQPQSTYWLFLAMRELNKIEDRIHTGKNGDVRSDTISTVRLEKFLASVLPTGKRSWDEYVQLMLVQCALVRHDHTLANHRMAALGSPKDERVASYKRVLAVFNNIVTGAIHSKKEQEQLADMLLDVLADERLTRANIQRKVAQSLMRLAAARYARSGAIALGGLYNDMSSYWQGTEYFSQLWEAVATPAILHDVLKVLTTNAAPKLKALLQQTSDPQPREVYQLLSLTYSNIGNFSDAADAARRSETLIEDPIQRYREINDLEPFWPRWVGELRKTYRRWRASELYDSLAVLQLRACTNQSSSRDKILYAHALYSTTWYGSAWDLSQLTRSVDAYSTAYDSYGLRSDIYKWVLSTVPLRHRLHPSHSDYYEMKRSIVAYKNALASARSVEDRSEAAFMLALCDRRRQESIQQRTKQTFWSSDLVKIDHRKLEDYYKHYGATMFAVRNTCPLIASYLRSDS